MRRTLFYGGAGAVLGASIGAVYTMNSLWVFAYLALFVAGTLLMVKGDENA
jgi:hypothetical protein